VIIGGLVGQRRRFGRGVVQELKQSSMPWWRAKSACVLFPRLGAPCRPRAWALLTSSPAAGNPGAC